MIAFARATGTLPRLAAAFAAAAALALAALPGTALATVEVNAMFVDPSTTTQAGGNTDLNIRMVLCSVTPTEDCTGDDLLDDVNGLKVHLPPGLVMNPQALPRCTELSASEPPCPANTAIGSASAIVDIEPEGSGFLSLTGNLYNMEPVGSELGHVGVVLYLEGTAIRALESDDGTVSMRPTDHGLDATFLNLPRKVGAINIRIREITLNLNGIVNGVPFVTNPTSCVATSWGLEAANESDVWDSYTLSGYVPSNCAGLAFQPSLQMTTGAAGQTNKDAHPPLTVTVSNPAGGAAIRTVQVTLPDTLRPNVSGIIQSLCTTGLPSQGACPASSIVGSASITTPLLAGPIQGSVYLVHQGSGQLPKLSVLLSGQISLQIDSQTSFNGTRTVHTFTGLPDFPISTLQLNFAGGKSGILTNHSSLCTASVPAASVAITGHNGGTVQQSAQPSVAGCNGSPISISKRSLKMKKSGVVAVRLTCAAGGSDCDGTLKLQTAVGSSKKKARRRTSRRSRARTAAKRRRTRRSKARATSLGRRSFLIPAGTSATLRVKVSSKGRKALLRLKRQRRRVKATATVIGAAAATETVKIKVRKAKRSKKRSKRRR